MNAFVQMSDAELFDSFERQIQVIRDRTNSVAYKHHTGVYIAGRPGTSKAFTVQQTLQRLGVRYVVQNARMTPMGLYDCLNGHPEHVIVLDDIASLFTQHAAVQILLAALDGDPGTLRTVTYKSKDEDISFQFAGGIIALSNLPLCHDPLAAALDSRVVQLVHEPSDDELAAYMRYLATLGYKDLSPEQCREVVNFIVAETRNNDQRLDMRHMTRAFEDRLQWENGYTVTTWQDLFRTSHKKKLFERATPLSKAEDMELQRQSVKNVIKQIPDDRDQQIKLTGSGKSTFYKRLKEVTSE